MVAQIHADNLIVRNQGARQHPQVTQGTEHAVNQNNRWTAALTVE